MAGITLLAADDEPTVLLFLRTVIEREKLPVDRLLEADNGLDATRLGREHRPELALLDIRMPGQDGLAVAKTLRKETPETRIAIISAHDDFGYAREALRLGVQDYLLKPVKPGDLAALIHGAGRRRANPAPFGEEVLEVPLPALVSAVRHHVKDHIAEDLSLPAVAKAVFVSPHHLSRTFKRLTGVALAEYILEQRLEKARILLAGTGHSITAVAAMAGFDNAGYFATCFRKKNGLSPREYRQERQAHSMAPRK